MKTGEAMTTQSEQTAPSRNDGGTQSQGRSIALIIWAVGVVLFVLLAAYIWYYQSKDASQGALGMMSMHMNKMGKFWSFPILQASGLVALLTSWCSIFFGLHQSSKAVSWIKASPKTIDVIHRNLSLLTVGLVIVHVVATAFDAMGDSFRSVLWFNGWATSWPQANFAYNIGIVAFYLCLLLGPTYYLRQKIGVSRWKFLHRFIVVFYVLALWHALILGLDINGYGWLRPVIWIAQIPLLYLVARRMVELAQRASTGKPAKWFEYGLSAVCILAGLGIVVLVLTGHAGFIRNV
jgi:DMSO/TMAO reductase YedYZ heme-binding membrane subunit